MTEIEMGKVMDVMRELMTVQQLKFFNSYLKNDRNVPKTSKDTGIGLNLCYRMTKAKQIVGAMKMLTMSEGDQLDVLPTLEYLSIQWKILYDRAVAAGEDKVAAQILDKRMKYYEMFDTLRKEDRINLSKLTTKELLEIETERHNEVMELLARGDNNVWKGV